MKRAALYLLVLLNLLNWSCKKEDDDEQSTLPALVVPQQYDSSTFAANTSAQLSLINNFKALVTEVKKGRIQANTLNEGTLNTLFSNGSPSVAGSCNSYYSNLLTGSNGYFAQAANASGKTYKPDSSSSAGGVYGSYLFNQFGLEPEQMIDKGLYGAMLYYTVTQILSQNLSSASADRALLLYGSSPAFPNSNDAAKHPVPDAFAAGYIARRDKNDGKGLYTTVRYNFIKLQAAIKAGPLYKNDQDAAIAAIKLNWEKGNAATVINYLHSVIATLSGTNLTDAQKSSALHSYSESVGFIHGWRNIPQKDKKITDAQIDQILGLLLAPANADPSSHLFITDSFNQLPKLSQVINELKNIYGFSSQEIEDFKSNWVSIQGR